jgi:hypothetical protein
MPVRGTPRRRTVRTYGAGAVVVQAQPVQIGADQGHVAVALGQFDAVDLAHVLGEAPAVDGVQPPAVGVAVHAAGGGEVLLAVGGRVDGGEVVDDAHLRVRGGRTDGLHRQAVTEEQVVGGADRRREVRQTGGHDAFQVTDPGGAQGFVEGGPVRDAVAEAPGDDRRVGREVLRRGPGLPAGVAVLEHLRQVPVVEGHGRRDARLQQRVDQLVVKGQALGVDRAVAAGYDARPGHRQAVGVGAQPAHQVDVLAPAVVVVAGDVAVVVVVDLARDVGEGVPDRR